MKWRNDYVVDVIGAVGGRPDLLSNSTPPPSELPSVNIEKWVKFARSEMCVCVRYLCVKS